MQCSPIYVKGYQKCIFSGVLNMVPIAGQYAPDFCLESHLGQTIRLSDYRNRCNVVLAFFPLAWTPV
jgi:hypothetical protein